MDSDSWEWGGYFRLGDLQRVLGENDMWYERWINTKDTAKDLGKSFTDGRKIKGKGKNLGMLKKQKVQGDWRVESETGRVMQMKSE